MPLHFKDSASVSVILGAALLMTACSTTIVRKIPVGTDKQAEADAIEGFRYYMPRPYFAVKKEFPVESNTLLVEATFSADGNYLIFDVTEGSGLVEALGKGSWSVRVPPETGGPKGENAKGGGEAAKPAAKKAEEKDSGGKVTLGGEGSPASVVKVGDLFDIVYLPDFTEQYAVRVKPRLSQATLDMSLGQGWMLESAKLEIDNSVVADFLFEQIDSTLDVLRDAFRLDEGLIAPAVEEEEEEGAETEEGEAVEGSPQGVVDTSRKGIVRVQIRKLAVPGVYPMLKPGEIKRLADASGWTEGPLNCRKKSPLMVAQVGVICLTSRSEILIERALPPAPAGGPKPPPPSECKKGLLDKVKKVAAEFKLASIEVKTAVLATTKTLRVEVKAGATEKERKTLVAKLEEQIKGAADEWCGAKEVAVPKPSGNAD